MCERVSHYDVACLLSWRLLSARLTDTIRTLGEVYGPPSLHYLEEGENENDKRNEDLGSGASMAKSKYSDDQFYYRRYYRAKPAPEVLRRYVQLYKTLEWIPTEGELCLFERLEVRASPLLSISLLLI